jgi:hypothetical protein
MTEPTGPTDQPPKGPPGVVPPAHRIAASAIARLNVRPPTLWIVSGPPSPRRTEIALAIANTFTQAARVDGDALATTIVRGRVLPGETPEDESERQVELAIRNHCILARSFSEAGFTPVIEYAVLTRHHLDAYRNYLAGAQLRLAVVPEPSDVATPLTQLLRDELTGIGHWIDDADPAAAARAAFDSGTAVLN